MEINKIQEYEGPLFAFIGQAGFIFKTVSGTLLGVDLYLSNCVEEYDGFKRLFPNLLNTEKVKFDYLISTHAHLDHLDIDSVPHLLKKNTKMFVTENCIPILMKRGLKSPNISTIKHGDEKILNDIKVNFVFADHGKAAPDAVGLVIELNEFKFYITGDTRLRLDKLDEIKKYGPFDYMFTVINGAFGNLDSTEAAIYTSLIKPRVVIPYHFWTFVEHLSNPILFKEKMNLYDREIIVNFMRVGEVIKIV